MAFNAGTVKGQLSFDHSSFTKAAKTIKKDQTEITKKTKTAGGAFKGMWKQVAAGVGVTALVTGGIRAISTAISDTIQKGREFEDAWSSVNTMISDTSINTEDLRDELINLSPTLGSTTDLARGMYQVLSASVEPAAAIEFLGEAAKSAKAGVTDVATSVDALTTVINAYGMEAADVTKISDVMFQTVKRGKLTYGELATSLGTVVPIAANLGVNFTEIGATMATMTRQGIDASTATMQLRQVLMSILTPSESAMKVADELGISLGANALKTKGLVGWLIELREKTGGSADAMGKLVPNARALTGVMALAGDRIGEMVSDQNLMNEAFDIGGQTSEAFSKKMQDATFWLDAGKEATNKFKTAFYLGFVEPFKAGITNADELDKITKDLTATMSSLGEALGILSKTAIPILGQQLEIWTGHLNNIFNVAGAIIWKIKGGTKAVEDQTKAITRATWKDFIADTAAAAKAQYDATGSIDITTAAVDKGTVASRSGAAAWEELSKKIKATKVELTAYEKFTKDQAILTIAEKSAKVNELKGFLETLHQEYKDGILDYETYMNAVDEVKAKISELSTTIGETAIPAANDWSIAVQQASGEVSESTREFTGVVQEEASKVNEIWARMASNLTSGMAAAFTEAINLGSIFYPKLEEFDSTHWEKLQGNAETAYEEKKAWIMENISDEEERSDALFALEEEYQDKIQTLQDNELAARDAHNKKIEEQQNSLWGKLRTVFGDTLNDMLNTYLQTFISGILGGAAEAASGLLGSLGGALGSIFGGGGEGEGGGGIGGLIGGIGGASPWGAIASGVGGLLGGLLAGGGDKHLLEGIKENTWETKMDLRNVVNNQDFLKERADWSHGELTTVNAQLNSIKISNWKIEDATGRMKNTLWRLETIFKNITSAAVGYKSTKNELVMTHGTPADPEYIIPSEDIVDPAETPGLTADPEGGGGAKPKPTFDIKIKSVVNLIGTIITDREHTRETIIPEMIAAFEANIRKVDFIESLDIPT